MNEKIKNKTPSNEANRFKGTLFDSMEYLEKRLTPHDYEMIFYHQQASLKDAIFEFEHYNRVLKKYSEKKEKICRLSTVSRLGIKSRLGKSKRVD